MKTGSSWFRKAKAMVTRDPDILGGHPVFAGTRVLVHNLADIHGDSVEAIHVVYPPLSVDNF